MEQVYIIGGTETALMEQEKRRYEEAVFSAFPQGCAVEENEGCAEKECIHLLESISLFQEATLYVIKNPTFLPIRKVSGRTEDKETTKGNSKKLTPDQERLCMLLSQLPKEVYLLFYVEGTMQTGPAFYKRMQEIGKITSYAAVTAKTVMPYVTAYVEKAGKRLDWESQHYLSELFYSWDTVSLPYIYTEFDRFFLTLDEGRKELGMKEVAELFHGYGNGSIFRFVDVYLQRTSLEWQREIESYWDTPTKQIKNTAYLASQLRALKAYLELKKSGCSEGEVVRRLTATTGTKNSKYLLMRLKRYGTKWQEEELDRFLVELFLLQVKQRQGKGSAEDIIMVLCMMMGKRTI